MDFDGTLSAIVETPDEARPATGAPEVLRFLAERFAVVAVVSGRPASQLLEWLGPEVEIWGLHGAERVSAGEVKLSEDAASYAATMRQVLNEARAAAANGPEGVLVEDKGVVVGLHYRKARDRKEAERWLLELAGNLSVAHDLRVAPGRLVLELRPPVEFSKKAVVLRRTREAGLRAVAFAGDDLVDLPGFDALDELSEAGLETLRIAVGSEEAPRALMDRADIAVDGPSGLVTLMNELVQLAGRGA